MDDYFEPVITSNNLYPISEEQEFVDIEKNLMILT